MEMATATETGMALPMTTLATTVMELKAASTRLMKTGIAGDRLTGDGCPGEGGRTRIRMTVSDRYRLGLLLGGRRGGEKRVGDCDAH